MRPGDHATLLLLSAVRPGRHAITVALRSESWSWCGHAAALRDGSGSALPGSRGKGAGAQLRIGVVNRGDLDEWIGRDRVRLTLRRAGRVVARPAPLARRLLARSRGVVVAPLRGGLRGRYVLEVGLLRPRPSSPVVRRRYIVLL